MPITPNESIHLTAPTAACSETTETSSTTSTNSSIVEYNNNHQSYFNTDLPIPSVPTFPSQGDPPQPVWSNPYGKPNGGIYEQSYLFLEAMKANPYNSNYAIIFLECCCELAAIGAFGTTDDPTKFATELLDIQGPNGKSLVDECVDVAMAQMCITGGCTPNEAAVIIETMFPGDDPVSTAIRGEADWDAQRMNDYEETDQYKNSTPEEQQQELEEQWYSYMTDDATISSIDEKQAELMSASLNSCGENIYAALLILLLLLEAAAVTNIDGQANLSNQLTDETAQLNTLITEWNNGFDSADDAEQWMNDLQDLQNEMNETPFSDDMMESINTQFDTIYDQQAMLAWSDKAYPLYIDENGTVWADTGNGYDYVYYNSDGTYDLHSGKEPQGELTPLTIGDQAFGYTAEDGTEYPPNEDALYVSFQEFQPQDVNPDDPSRGGFSQQDSDVDSSLDALTKPITSQSNMVGAEMQRIAGNIKIYENVFESTLVGDSGCVGFEAAINANTRA